VVADERADEPLRELAPDDVLQLIAGTRGRLRHPFDAGTVHEESADGSAVGGRRCGFHGTSFIGAPSPVLIPGWSEDQSR
jgi:hypothetical protein